MARKASGAFTLIELLVVVAIIAVLIAVMMPSLAAARRSMRRTRCAANLAGIGKAMITYAGPEHSYPLNLPPKLASKVGKWSVPPSALKCDDGVDMFGIIYTSTSTIQGDPFVNQWLLVAEGFITNSNQFVCPSDPQNPTPAEQRYAMPVWTHDGTFLNFGTIGDLQGAGPTFSYSFAYPWSGPNATVPRWWTGDGNDARVLAADMGPSKSLPLDDPTAAEGTPVSNSKNHEGRGQNVLFADGHVTFETRNDVGINMDNIFTGDGGNIFIMPSVSGTQKVNTTVNFNARSSDTLLVPTNP